MLTTDVSRSFESPRQQGKAVKTGHSCAAVTHQSKALPRGSHRAAKPIGFAPGEGGAEAGARENAYATHAESEHPCLRHSRVRRETFARGGFENFIAKMKRESSAFARARPTQVGRRVVCSYSS